MAWLNIKSDQLDACIRITVFGGADAPRRVANNFLAKNGHGIAAALFPQDPRPLVSARIAASAKRRVRHDSHIRAAPGREVDATDRECIASCRPSNDDFGSHHLTELWRVRLRQPARGDDRYPFGGLCRTFRE